MGPHLVAALRARGDEVTTASLRDPAAAATASAGADAVINLAGEPVSQRWTPEVKERIHSSRCDAVNAFCDALAAQDTKPASYVSASAVGYYGTSETASYDESSAPGSDFLAQVCVAWEAAADRAAASGARVAKLRLGLVLGREGGVLGKLLPVFKAGGGGVVASGRQWHSWVHIDDAIGVFLHALDGTDGVLNVTAPGAVRNSDFTHALGKAVHRPTVFPVPAFALKLMLGDGAYIVTEGQLVLPTRTLETGFRVKYATIDAARAAIVSS